MNLDIWFSWYKTILDEFGFSQDDDEKSAIILNKLLKKHNGLNKDKINIKNKVIVFGAGPSLKKNIIELKKIDLNNFTLISADGATTALLEEDIIPDIIVTDLDGKMDDIIKANNEGAILVIHAHGNNIEKVEKYVPTLQRILGTTQSIPLENVYNFGGFTDGDRCIFLASEFGANLIILAGMDFGKIVTKYSRPDLENSEDTADEIKTKKLKFAKELTEWAAENENVNILNISGGEKLENVKNVGFSDINDLN
ncbi:6-hydroxymethylpterin diphosphokinase MptE-like protein [Methanobacterium oryzae]|uniref:6-hydroxymethylpterin diphosphokinase MptE-like protein n=1 Tax=Methanobacterium oryzae TaxID=69540 RepID=UPI003D24FB4A